MNKVKPIGIYITEFISTKDKNIRACSIPELIKEGNITNFMVIFKLDESSDKKYKTQRIYKLDLYHKEITTIDQRRYKIMNSYEISKIK